MQIDKDLVKLYTNDTVNSPSHYCTGGVETIESIKNIVTGNPSVYQGYLIGNCIKYVSRYYNKGGAEDIKKAIKYLEFVLEDIWKNEEKQV